MSCSDFQEIECKQCIKLLEEVGKLKRGQQILRLKIKSQAEENQKLEEQLQDEVNYSATLNDTLKELGE